MLAWLPGSSRKWLGLALPCASLLAACGGLPAVSSGHIGCAESDITIENENRGWSTYTWTARCHGKTFFCSMVNGSNESTQTHCTPAEASAPLQTGSAAAPVAPPPPAATAALPAPAGDPGGCKYDTQCKGDRICERGICVTPAVAPAAPPAAP